VPHPRWTVEETVKLFRAIQKLTGVQLCKPGLKDLTDTEVDKGYTPRRISKNNPNFQPDPALQLVSKYIDFQAAKQLVEHSIPWTTVASRVKTKSKDACRNRWNTQVHNTIHSEDFFTSKQTQLLIDGIRNQDVDYEEEIDFSEISNGHSVEENRHHWERLKKLVTSRCMTSVSQVLIDLVAYMRVNKAPGAKYRTAGKTNNQNQSDSDAEDEAEEKELQAGRGHSAASEIGQRTLWDMFRRRLDELK
jgi:hypothetical protein